MEKNEEAWKNELYLIECGFFQDEEKAYAYAYEEHRAEFDLLYRDGETPFEAFEKDLENGLNHNNDSKEE